MKLTDYINQIESYSKDHEKKNRNVSESTVGWQIDHILRVIIGVLNTMKTAPIDKSSKLTTIGRFCLFTRYIPRGKGKAPSYVLPTESITLDSINQQLKFAKDLIGQIPKIDSRATFKHLYFGQLNKAQTIRFIEVHTNHHLKIVKDILKA